MKTKDTVGVDFCNTVINRGIYCGVANITLGVFNFTPSDDQTGVDTDHVVSVRLRMDLECLKQLRDATNDLMALLEKAQNQPEAEIAPTPRPVKRGEKTH